VDKQQQLEGMCAELEAANIIGNSRQVFQIVKSMTQKFQLVMLNSVFSCNRSSIVQNRILTEARSLPVDAYHAMSTESATRNRKRRLT